MKSSTDATFPEVDLNMYRKQPNGGTQTMLSDRMDHSDKFCSPDSPQHMMSKPDVARLWPLLRAAEGQHQEQLGEPDPAATATPCAESHAQQTTNSSIRRHKTGLVFAI